MQRIRFLAAFVVMLALLVSAGQVAGRQPEPAVPSSPYGYAFTYQGQLKNAGGPVDGSCDLRFGLWDAEGGGAPVGSPIELEGVEIQDGLFTARLDFGRWAHTGAARWLEVAVRCPAGSGDYVTLNPRQELTGVPAALSLALPFYAEGNDAALLTLWNLGGGVAGQFVSQSGTALSVPQAGMTGLEVASAGGDGVGVGATGQNGLRVSAAGTNGLMVSQAGANGVHVVSANGSGVLVSAAGWNGLDVGTAGGDGLYVNSAGSPSASLPSDWHNGVEVAGAEGSGLYVGRADAYGVVINSASDDGVFVGSVTGSGYWVGSATAKGLGVAAAGADGVYIGQAGSPSASTPSDLHNGVEVAGAEGDGLYVGRADDYGVRVLSAGAGGVYAYSVGGAGVRGESQNNDGVVGWTASEGQSGVYGHSEAGSGVTGISTEKYGVLAITSSSDPVEAALWARNYGAGPAVHAEGDLVVTGAYRGDIGPNGGAAFPRPAYDSGWIALDMGEYVFLSHNIGGNTDNYVVDMIRRSPYMGIDNIGDGEDQFDPGDTSGYGWSNLTDQTIQISRGNNDYGSGPYSMEFRVRIWVYR